MPVGYYTLFYLRHPSKIQSSTGSLADICRIAGFHLNIRVNEFR